MRIRDIKGRSVALAGVALATAGLIAACGSSTTTSITASSSASSSNGRVKRSAFVACLKQHGVTLPSRPPGSGAPGGGEPGSGAPGGGAGGGLFGGGGGRGRLFGGAARNPKFAAAIRACGGGNFRGAGARGRFRLSHTAVTNFVACVRRHGYDLPTPNFSGKGPVFPSDIRTNKKFEAAARACQQLLVPARPQGSSTTPSA